MTNPPVREMRNILWRVPQDRRERIQRVLEGWVRALPKDEPTRIEWSILLRQVMVPEDPTMTAAEARRWVDRIRAAGEPAESVQAGSRYLVTVPWEDGKILLLSGTDCSAFLGTIVPESGEGDA